MSKKDFSLDTADALRLPLPMKQPKPAEKAAPLTASKPSKPAPKPQGGQSMVDGLVFEKKERRKSITIHIQEALIDKLDKGAEDKNVSRSLLLETLLNQVL